MFAGDAAAEIDALAKDFIARFQHAFDLFSISFIEQQDWVNVAIPRVEHVDDANSVFHAAGDDELKNLRELCSRDDTVLSTVTGTEPPDCAEGLLAALPQQQSLFRGIGLSNFAGTVLMTD